MATPIYLRSTDGNDGDDGTTWALAKATLVGSLAVVDVGGTVFVSQVHAETQASNMILTSPGTAADPVEIICGNDAAEPPTAVATTATVTTTGTADIVFSGFAYIYGIAFSAATSGATADMTFTSTSPWWFRFEDCSLGNNSNNVGTITVGTNSISANESLLELINTPIVFNNVNQTFELSDWS